MTFQRHVSIDRQLCAMIQRISAELDYGSVIDWFDETLTIDHPGAGRLSGPLC